MLQGENNCLQIEQKQIDTTSEIKNESKKNEWNDIIETSPLPHFNIKDLRGQRFGRLLVIRFDYQKTCSGSKWICRCSCGKSKLIAEKHLSQTSSCGCLGLENRLKVLRKHGMYGTDIFNIWQGMLQRCLNKKSTGYKRYGARGITVCERWREFENFYEDMGNRPKGKSLDRIDNNGNYCKENCRWADCKTQSRNKRDNTLITYKGETKTIIEWSEITGIGHSTLSYRIHNNYPIDKIFTTPEKRKKYFLNGKRVSIAGLGKEIGVNSKTIFYYLDEKGLSLEDALKAALESKNRKNLV